MWHVQACMLCVCVHISGSGLSSLSSPHPTTPREQQARRVRTVVRGLPNAVTGLSPAPGAEGRGCVLCVLVCLSVCIHVPECVCLCTSVSLSLCLCVCPCIRVCLCCVCVCAHAYVMRACQGGLCCWVAELLPVPQTQLESGGSRVAVEGQEAWCQA